MKSRQNTALVFGSIIAGTILGLIGGPVFILIPWGIIGLAIGFFSPQMKLAIISGALYGFAATFTFMLAGYAGEAPVITRIMPFAVIGLVGAVCGLISSLVGYLIHRYYFRKK